MTREETIEAIRVMKAWVNGKEIQASNKSQPQWVNISKEPHWDWHYWDYRIKPTKKFRPWRTEEVPVGAVIRYKRNPSSIRHMIVCSQENGLVGYNTFWTYEVLLTDMEHSTDYGRTWLPCGVEEGGAL